MTVAASVLAQGFAAAAAAVAVAAAAKASARSDVDTPAARRWQRVADQEARAHD